MPLPGDLPHDEEHGGENVAFPEARDTYVAGGHDDDRDSVAEVLFVADRHGTAEVLFVDGRDSVPEVLFSNLNLRDASEPARRAAECSRAFQAQVKRRKQRKPGGNWLANTQKNQKSSADLIRATDGERKTRR